MPCQFSGVFYVLSRTGNTLKCKVRDEEGFIALLDITHWLPGKDAGKPFTVLAEPFRVRTAFYMMGDFIIKDNNNSFYVPPIYY